MWNVIQCATQVRLYHATLGYSPLSGFPRLWWETHLKYIEWRLRHYSCQKNLWTSTTHVFLSDLSFLTTLLSFWVLFYSHAFPLTATSGFVHQTYLCSCLACTAIGNIFNDTNFNSKTCTVTKQIFSNFPNKHPVCGKTFCSLKSHFRYQLF